MSEKECSQCIAIVSKKVGKKIRTRRCKNTTCKGQKCWIHLDYQDGLRIKKSTLPDVSEGLFATRNIKAGDRIGIYEGEVSSEPIKGDYVFKINSNKYVDAKKTNSCAVRYANVCRTHNQNKKQCKGNKAKLSVIPKTQTGTLKAKYPIKKGEEIFTSYGPAYWKESDPDETDTDEEFINRSKKTKQSKAVKRSKSVKRQAKRKRNTQQKQAMRDSNETDTEDESEVRKRLKIMEEMLDKSQPEQKYDAPSLSLVPGKYSDVSEKSKRLGQIINKIEKSAMRDTFQRWKKNDNKKGSSEMVEKNVIVIDDEPDESASVQGKTKMLKDLDSLNPRKWVKDLVIDEYFKILYKEYMNKPGTKQKIHFYDTGFYTYLTDQEKGYNFKAVSKKFKNPFIFDKVFIPINSGRNHWLLAVIDIRNKIISVYDSMMSRSRCEKVFDNLTKWLKDHAPIQFEGSIDSWKQECANIPQQTNGFDCGVFTMKFADHVLYGKNKFEDMKFFTKDMPKYRSEIKSKIADEIDLIYPSSLPSMSLGRGNLIGISSQTKRLEEIINQLEKAASRQY